MLHIDFWDRLISHSGHGAWGSHRAIEREGEIVEHWVLVGVKMRGIDKNEENGVQMNKRKKAMGPF